MARKQTASDLADNAVALIEQLEAATKDEVRQGLAERLLEMTTLKGEKNLLECHTDPNFEPTEEFLAGLRFAAELIADKDFDY